jgi:hypothetical protein
VTIETRPPAPYPTPLARFETSHNVGLGAGPKTPKWVLSMSVGSLRCRTSPWSFVDRTRREHRETDANDPKEKCL